MFSMCANMKWAHLPIAGGVYDQDPELLRRWRIIWSEQAAHQAEEDRKRKRESKTSSGGNGLGRSSRPRRR